MIRLNLTGLALLLVACGCATSRLQETRDLTPLLHKASPQIHQVLTTPEKFRVQILIAEVVTNQSGRVALQRSGYRVDAEYFYPASSIKLCAAVVALQTIEQLQAQHRIGDLLETPMEIAPLFPGDVAQTNDPSNLAGGGITVGHEIRKIGLVSDNQAYNRLYDLVGHEGLNRSMHALGLKSTVLNHRLSDARTIPDMLATAAVNFHVPGAEPIRVPARRSALNLANSSKDLFIGTGYMKGETLTNAPMDFTRRNGISLVDLQDLLIKVTRPDIDLGTPALQLSPVHREMLLAAMSMYPGESHNPVYSAERHPDINSKFLLPGIRRVFPKAQLSRRIEVTGKPGRAYGFSIENSYVHNPKNGRAVFVTAVLYTNSDGILNDDKYDYETVADSFLADLGELVARRWLGD
ncbi:MAG: serine hydrolase [Verrucomicrobiota bacterium]